MAMPGTITTGVRHATGERTLNHAGGPQRAASIFTPKSGPKNLLFFFHLGLFWATKWAASLPDI
jgi:hypothetical protein